MCGLFAIFAKNLGGRASCHIDTYLKKQAWRGPDHCGIWTDDQHRAYLGHNRLIILDDSYLANMPMVSDCQRFVLIYNGEIYNHMDIRRRFRLSCKTHSDSETLLYLYAKIGDDCVNYLEGMFAFVIYDQLSGHYFAARDQLGIKPLFYSENSQEAVFGSEAAVISEMVGGSPSATSIEEWKVFRRPIGGKTFFDKVHEIPPGHIYHSATGLRCYWQPVRSDKIPTIEQFYHELKSSINAHLINDYKTVSLLSGGLDSAVILGLSGVDKAYTVGMPGNNEFQAASESAKLIGAELVNVEISSEELQASWRNLLSMRQEPLAVPNEGLIFSVCKAMNFDEKVVLTGEGADELLFGYDRIFLWSQKQTALTVDDFLSFYSYNNSIGLRSESRDYIAAMMEGKKPIEFMEDFFIKIHLPGLLRRMDAASMCASKEARVPFVTTKLFNMFYRQPLDFRYSDGFSKYPLRAIARDLNLIEVINRKKIGFSAAFNQFSQKAEYDFFQKFCLDNLGWS